MSVCPSPKGEGIELSAFLCDGVMISKVMFRLRTVLASPLYGEMGEGFEFECGCKKESAYGGWVNPGFAGIVG